MFIAKTNRVARLVFFMSSLFLFGCDTTSRYGNYLVYSRSIGASQSPQGSLSGTWSIQDVTCQGVSVWKNEQGQMNLLDSNLGSFAYIPQPGCTINFSIRIQKIDSTKNITFSQAGTSFLEPDGCYSNPNPKFSTFSGNYALNVNQTELTITSSNMSDFCGPGVIPAVMTLEKQTVRF